MTENHAEKKAARAYASAHAVGYRRALAAVRAGDAVPAEFVLRLLIEAVEGCGIRHWARIDRWDGRRSAEITDLGGERYSLNTATLGGALTEHLARHPGCRPLDIDSYLADELVQTALFGAVIYRTQVRRRPVMVGNPH